MSRSEIREYVQRLAESRRQVGERLAAQRPAVVDAVAQARAVAEQLRPVAERHRRRQRMRLTLDRWLALPQRERERLFPDATDRAVIDAAARDRTGRF
jgi:hypothetical protein